MLKSVTQVYFSILGCRPECTIDQDCSANKACLRSRCESPCNGICGLNADCRVLNHRPQCECIVGYTGDPYQSCSPTPPPPDPKIEDKRNPCYQSPCGMNAECKERGEAAACVCYPEYFGDPHVGKS